MSFLTERQGEFDMFVLTMMFAVHLLTNLLVFLFTFLVEAMDDGLVNYRISRFDFDDDGVGVVFAGGRLVGSGVLAIVGSFLLGQNFGSISAVLRSKL